MYNKLNFKRLIAGLLLMSIISTNIPQISFASGNYENSKDITISKINDNSIKVNSYEKEEILNIIDSKNETKIEIKDINTGKIEYIIYNKEDDSIYSSITGNTIYNNEISFYKSDVSYITKKLSFAEIRSALGNVSSAGGVLALILAKFPGGKKPSKIIGYISSLMGGAATFGIPNDRNHGLTFKIKVTKMYRSRLGKRHVYKRMHDIVSIRRY